jgi:sugar O-acyltransferase (sialic acid O-acetyltransferase NeuD family)
MTPIVLVGVRSPMLPDYEECCSRAGLRIAAAVKTDKLRPRILNRDALVDLVELTDAQKGLGFIACAFNPYRRDELSDIAVTAGLLPADPLLDPSAIVATSSRLGQGTFVNAGSIIGSAGILGEHVIINRASNIGHHTILDDFVSIGPGVTLAGNVRIGRKSFVGAGSVILPGVRIGAGAVIAAGSVVRADVGDEVLVAGNPAQLRQKRPSPSMLGKEGEE